MMGVVRWHDVSIPLKSGMAVWPGDEPFALEAAARMAKGAECNISRLSCSVHTGTHIDAPWHFEDDGKRIHELDPNLFFGPALIVDVPDVTLIMPEHLGSGPLPSRVLFKTRNSDIPFDGPFRGDYTALDTKTAQRLVELGVKLVGIDYLSVGPYQQPGQATHHCLLGNDIVIVEGLRLAGFLAGLYEFVVLPLALIDADGSPCRAFIGVGEN